MTHVIKSTTGSDGSVESRQAGDVQVNSDEHEVNGFSQHLRGTSLLDDLEQASAHLGLSIATPQTSPTSYKNRIEEFRKTFKELSESERLIADYNCALQKDILLQGRMFLTENWLCFYSHVFWGTKIKVNMKDITSMSREKTARLIPNAIQIVQSDTEKLFFTSFSAREKSFQSIFHIWQNCLNNKQLTGQELWQMVKQHYGNDLGLSQEDMDSMQMIVDTVPHNQSSLSMRAEDPAVKLERPSSLRLPQVEQMSHETSTPQGDDTQSSIGVQSTLSPNGDDARSTPSQPRTPNLSLNRFSNERVSKRSSLSLDLNANEDRLSDNSLTDSMEEERGLTSQESPGRLYVNGVFNFSVKKMFDLLFTNSAFSQRFMDARKITGVTCTPWQRDNSGNKKRTLNYTVTITNPLVGKSSTVTENQTLYQDSKEGHYYLVDSEVYTHDVPYHDYFYTLNRYHIIHTSKYKCRLQIYTDVKYNKQPWGVVKSFITKNSWSGLEEYFKHLEAELHSEELEYTQGSSDSGKGGLRRRRRTFSRTLQEHVRPSRQYSVEPEQHREGAAGVKNTNHWNITSIIAVMSLILLVLTILNLGLFFKLWAMEDVAHRMYLSTKQRMRDRADASLTPDFGPQQNTFHRNQEDARLLRAVLQDSINLLEQLRNSLVVLQQNFQGPNKTASKL
ncbi:protein Aster-C isoform X2 [Neoarius graeffei]|uniref:protein Aster-C isoform X2 n=1 Tax=Neoarius graeffei TaxID=443677 RepID=UPI00298CB4DE|nr:protein Aster-C isoform X2 [Neoarius graeffei]